VKKFSLLISIFILSFNVAAKEWKTIRIAVEGAYPPYSQTETDGSVTGFDIDISHALCEVMQAKCTLIKQDWDGIIPGLMARKYDAIIATMAITEARKKKIAFTDKYQHIPSRFVALKGIEYQGNAEFMAGKKVGVQRGTTMDLYISDNFPQAEIKRYATAEEAFLDLKATRLDYVLANPATIIDGLLNKDGGDKFDLVGPKLTDPRWFGEGVGIAIRKQDKDLAEQFNAALKEIRANGTYKLIQDKYFSFDIYGA